MNKKTLEKIKNNTRRSIHFCIQNIQDITDAMLEEDDVEGPDFQYLQYMIEGEVNSISGHLSSLNTACSMDMSQDRKENIDEKELENETKEKEKNAVEEEVNVAPMEEVTQDENAMEDEEPDHQEDSSEDILSLQKDRGKELVMMYDDVTIEDKKLIKETLTSQNTREDIDQAFHLLKRELENKYGDTSPSNESRTQDNEVEDNFERLFGNMLDDE